MALFGMGAPNRLAVVRASLPCSAGSETKVPLAAPMASAVRMPDTSPLGAMETRLTSPPPAASTSCSAISTP